MRKFGIAALALVGAGASAFWVLTMPERLDEVTLTALDHGDAVRGERIFWAGGCASCHARPGAQGETRLELAGGLRMPTEFGTFVPPNISPDPQDGIGSWTAQDFGNAMMRGVSPDGSHLYPSFPYTSYARMQPADVADLYAFMRTLPLVAGKAEANEVSFPFNIRRAVGLWKLLYLDNDPIISLAPDASEQIRLGQYLVEGAGHCAECHTPRDFAGGLEKTRWMAGAVAAEQGQGIVPNITSGDGGIGEWSAADIEAYLETGFTPEFDSVGGSMVDVQQNMARLSAEDRAAIAAYLKALPPHPNGYPARTRQGG